MLRTIFVIFVIAAGIRYSIRGAFYLLLFYLWIAYFRPEQWLWVDFVSSLQLSFVVGLGLVLTTLFSKERFRFGFGAALVAAFLLQSLISTATSPAPHVNWGGWTEFARVLTITYLISILVTTEHRMRLVLLVIAVSLGFEGAKQGWAQMILNPGAVNTNSLPLLGDNNGVAVGMLMLVPIFTMLAATAPGKIERYAERVLLVGVLYRAISTYSRGGFLAAGALALVYLARARRKLVGAIAIGVVATIVLWVLPAEFWDRMSTIGTAVDAPQDEDTDVSIRGRLHFWQVAQEMAKDRPVAGVGFNAFNQMYDRYDFSLGAFGQHRSVHSAWFGVMAEIGYPGFVIFTLLIVRALLICWKARRIAKRHPHLSRLGAYGTALEASLIVFIVGGAFVPAQYSEMLWHLLGLSIALDYMVKSAQAAPVEVLAPAAVSSWPKTVPATRPLQT